MRFEEVLRQFSRFFEEQQIRYAVIGGLAMQAWGHSRFTRDIDIVVERNALDRVVKFAESRGYETLHVSEGYSRSSSMPLKKNPDPIDFERGVTTIGISKRSIVCGSLTPSVLPLISSFSLLSLRDILRRGRSRPSMSPLSSERVLA